MKLRTLIASFAALAGVTTAQAAVDATGIEPTLAISFNDKTLASTGSVTMKGQGSVSDEAFVDGVNGYALDLSQAGGSVMLYNSGSANTTISGTSSSEAASPFAVSILGTIKKVNRELVFAARYYTAARGVIVGFDGDGNLCYWWNNSTSTWGASNVIALPEDHDWTKPHHYVFSFGDHSDGCLRLYVDGKEKVTTVGLNNYSSGYRNPAAKSYCALSLGNAENRGNYNGSSSVIDDVRFYASPSAAEAIDVNGSNVNFVLSDAMVTKLYKNLIGDGAVVKIGTAGYPTLAAAVAVVQAGQTIVLQDNLVLTETTTLPKGANIDFNGKTITTADADVELVVPSDLFTIAKTEEDGVFGFAKNYLENVYAWNGADGAAWNDVANWLVKNEAATALPTAADTVVFGPFVGAACSVVINGTVAPAAVKVTGKYAFSGSGLLDVASVTVADEGEFGIAAANVYTGAIVMEGTSAAVRVAVGEGVAYTLGAMSGSRQESDNLALSIDSGVVTFSNLYRMHTTIALGATAIVSGDFGTLINDYYAWFQGEGDLVLDAVTINMNNRSDYGSTLKTFAGTMVLKNGTSIKFTNNGNSANGLGTGKVVLAGCELTGGNAGAGSFGNSVIEVVAGTANTSTAAFPLPLDKVVVTGDVKDLRKAERTVLTTTKGTLESGATVSQEMQEYGWKVRTVKTLDTDGETVLGYAVELFKSGLTIILK